MRAVSHEVVAEGVEVCPYEAEASLVSLVLFLVYIEYPADDLVSELQMLFRGLVPFGECVEARLYAATR